MHRGTQSQENNAIIVYSHCFPREVLHARPDLGREKRRSTRNPGEVGGRCHAILEVRWREGVRSDDFEGFGGQERPLSPTKLSCMLEPNPFPAAFQSRLEVMNPPGGRSGALD